MQELKHHERVLAYPIIHSDELVALRNDEHRVLTDLVANAAAILNEFRSKDPVLRSSAHHLQHARGHVNGAGIIGRTSVDGDTQLPHEYHALARLVLAMLAKEREAPPCPTEE